MEPLLISYFVIGFIDLMFCEEKNHTRVFVVPISVSISMNSGLTQERILVNVLVNSLAID